VSALAAAIGRVLALDPGSVRVGVAVSDSTRSMAFPRDPLQAGEGLVAAICQLVRDEEAALVVIGLPRSLDGREGSSALAARALADEVSTAMLDLDVAVELHDERLTTVEASSRLRDSGIDERRARRAIDSAAATVLLEDWLRTR
jgi:putative Holliday junction resolvase